MANTYYDSELTGEEIEQALEAIDGVIVPANNGKVLAVDNGKIVARSVQRGGGGSGGVSSVNSILPDGNGNVTLTADDIETDNNTSVQDEIDSTRNTLSDMENGVNENMTAGNAMQLDSSVYAEDQVPYLFRQTGGSVEAGNREEDCIVGATVAWNQVAKYEETEIPGTLNSHSASGMNVTLDSEERLWWLPQLTLSNRKIQSGHRYLVDFYIQLSEAAGDRTFFVVWGNTSSVTTPTIGIDKTTTNKQHISKVVTGISDATNGRFFVQSSFGGITIDISNAIVTDLTAMFGSTIADRAYALEQATAGSGIAWLKSMGFFTQDYYEYDAGTLKSVEGLQSHTMRGFNQWDEEWEVGSIASSTGQNADNNTTIRSKNYNPCIPNTTYYFKSGVIQLLIMLTISVLEQILIMEMFIKVVFASTSPTRRRTEPTNPTRSTAILSTAT